MRHSSKISRTLRITSLVATFALLSSLVACAVQPYGNPQMASYPSPSGGYQTVYPSAPVAQASYVEYGRVSNVEVFRTQEQAPNSGGGALLGGVLGAVVGNRFGSGSGRGVATVIGAVGGAAAGGAIESSRNGPGVRETYRVTVQMDNGPGRAYDVPSTGDLRIGDRVRIENGRLLRM